MRVRIWPYYVGALGATTRSTVVSPPFNGPLMITEFAFRMGGDSSNTGGLSMFYSVDGSGTVDSVANTIKPSGTPIFDQASFVQSGQTDADTIREHIPYLTSGGQSVSLFSMFPRFIIEPPGTYFLKISVQGSSTGGQHSRGYVVVVEGATVQDLVNFP